MVISIVACTKPADTENTMSKESEPKGKPVVYQVFTRLFGNTNDNNIPWGSIEQNGVGKFNDFTDAALLGIKELGVTHVWYTGVPHHSVINDYTEYGISLDDPDVVKGRAGSPYAVKDYYNVNPDLAVNPSNRLAEFEALIQRTHSHDMKVIIDIVPNHVARNYQSLTNPKGISDFGANDDSTVEYKRDNNFYYVVGQDFKVPQADHYQPLGGDPVPLSDGKFAESPAKWTGNGSRKAQPDINDWYETVKVNYGVKPNGEYDFPRLPEGYSRKDFHAHAEFWQGKSVPDSWLKFRDIVHYWLDKGVDGFRYDMAEMVPVEFWSYLNSSIKVKNPQAFLLAEVYNPDLYRDYLHLGKMDYLYDKVEFYDNLKWVMQGKGSTDELAKVQAGLQDIEQHMLHFLENHDEQRIASPEFAGDAQKGKPAMVVSSLISRSPTMLYFAQEVGEDGSEEPGFGGPSRTSIFDYVGVPAHQRWMNDGAFDGGKLSKDEKQLRSFYVRLLNISKNNPAMQGEYRSLHQNNRNADSSYNEKHFAFTRWKGDDRLIVVSNFDPDNTYALTLTLPAEVIVDMSLNGENYALKDLLSNTANVLTIVDGKGYIDVKLTPLSSFVFSVE